MKESMTPMDPYSEADLYKIWYICFNESSRFLYDERNSRVYTKTKYRKEKTKKDYKCWCVVMVVI